MSNSSAAAAAIAAAALPTCSRRKAPTPGAPEVVPVGPEISITWGAPTESVLLLPSPPACPAALQGPPPGGPLGALLHLRQRLAPLSSSRGALEGAPAAGGPMGAP